MSRYDDMPDAARELLSNFDEIDLAEMYAAVPSRSEVLLKAADLAEGSNPDRDPDFTEGVMWVVDLLRAEARTTPA